MVRSIQYLRAVAALMVVGVHCSEELKRLGFAELPLMEVLPAGVDIFFVISGFVIWNMAARKDVGPLNFMMMRLARIGPPYWAITLFVAAVAMLAPSLFASTKFDAQHVVASLLFVAWQHPTFHTYWPVVLPGWTLNYEMMFYVLFSLTLVLPRARQLMALVSVLGGLAVLGAVTKPLGVLSFYTDPIILEFGFGILLAAAFTAGARVGKLDSIALLVLGVCLLFLLPQFHLPRFMAAGIPALMICCASVFQDDNVPHSQAGIFLGDASYSIYLSHIFVLHLVTKAWLASGMGIGGLGTLAFVAAGLAAATLAGCLIYLIVERPMVGAARSAVLRGTRERSYRPT